MKKRSRILMMLLSEILIVTNLSACASNTEPTLKPEPVEVTEETVKQIHGIDIFTFLDKYYKNVPRLNEKYHVNIDSDFPDDPLPGILDDDVRNYVFLPCGNAFVQKSGFVLESMSVKLYDFLDTEAENEVTAVEAMAVFLSIEGNDWENPFSESVQNKNWQSNYYTYATIFSEKIIEAVKEKDVMDSLYAGDTVLLYTGNYNYSLSLRNYEVIRPENGDHKVIYLEVEAI